MKSLLFSLVFILMASIGFAQTKSETLKVSGECGSCKKKIEAAAKKAGATYAVWNVDSKELTVKYNSTSTNSAKIQKTIADVGYDTPDFKATDEAYNKLDGCCQYERTSTTANDKKTDSTGKN
ncbi:MAG TPA: cation transporter [Flavisolibacter sp.]|jgi:periplasmic mercuric ion binding protein|nr:cation transporter [Flavisolibacter sp.]